MKNERGITLIALVITIIVLLILAGVSISGALGDNGILSRAENTSDSYKIAEYQERVELLKGDLLIEHEGSYTIDDLIDKIKDTNTIPDGKVEKIDETSAKVTTKEGYEFVITVNSTSEKVDEIYEQAGLYDANGVMIASWEQLESYGFDIDAELDLGTSQMPTTILYSVLNGEHAEELKNAVRLVIPNSVTSIGYQAFYGWTSDQTINIKTHTSAPSTWSSSWNGECNATINWAQ